MVWLPGLNPQPSASFRMRETLRDTASSSLTILALCLTILPISLWSNSNFPTTILVNGGSGKQTNYSQNIKHHFVKYKIIHNHKKKFSGGALITKTIFLPGKISVRLELNWVLVNLLKLLILMVCLWVWCSTETSVDVDLIPLIFQLSSRLDELRLTELGVEYKIIQS